MTYHLALVTGATSGIGKATCHLLAKKGINLIISGRHQQQLEELKISLSSQVSVQALQADLAQAHERQHLISLLHDRVPDLVINNAGFGLYGEALTYSTEEQAAILEVNGRAVLELTLEAARTLISAAQKGVILNISSVAGFQILPMMTVYAASKAFVTHFSQALDFEVKDKGVRVLTLCPGMVATAFQERAGEKRESHESMKKMSADFVAEQVWRQINQLKPLSIVNWPYRLLIFLSFFMPKSWIAAHVKRMIAQRITPRHLIKINK